MLLSIRPYFDTYSMILYVFLGLLSLWALNKTKTIERRTGNLQSIRTKYYILWLFIWGSVAVFRLVANNKIGGADAANYISFFDKCMHPNVDSFYSHFYSDVCYRWVNQLAYIIYPDYHIFFFITYTFFTFSIIYFCNNFVPKHTNFTPFVLLFYIYLRGFSSIRSNYAISVLMIACVFFLKRKYILAFILAVTSILFHKSSAIYALVIPFCWYFRNKRLSLKYVLSLLIISIISVPILQNFAIEFIIGQEVDGVYHSYISNNMNASFWETGWTIAFEQMLLGVFMLVNYKNVKRNERNNDVLDLSRIKMLWNICVFDMLLIPINFGLHIWRGYEYFYVARLALWGYLIYLWLMSFDNRMKAIFEPLLLLVFIAWMVFRVYNTWEPSGLMPYVFDLF